MAGDVYCFGGWTVEPHLNRISQGGTEVHLEPLAMDILVYLLDRPGQTISVDTLLEAAWPGRVVELNTVYQTINQIRRALGDDARSPRFIETVRKRGYRAIAPAERVSCRPPGLEDVLPPNVAGADPSDGKITGIKRMGAVAIVLSLMITVAAAWWFGERPVPGNGLLQDDKPSIAVIPLVNGSNDPEQTFFSEGVAEDILNGLAKSPGVVVRARTSSFSFKGRDLEVREIARQLSVTHVVEVGVRRLGDRIRVSVGLIPSATEAILWAEQYDRETIDVFNLQDEITSAIFRALNVQVPAPSRRSPNLAAYDAFLQGRYNKWRLNLPGAIAHLREAIALDPEYADAYAELAQLYRMKMWLGSEPIEELIAAAIDSTDKALSLDPDQALALSQRAADAFTIHHDYQRSILEFDRLIRRYPNDVDVLKAYAWILRAVGHVDLALAVSARIETLDPFSAQLATEHGNILKEAGRLDEARRYYKKAEGLGASQPWHLAFVAFAERDAAALQRELQRDSAGWAAVGDLRIILRAGVPFLTGDTVSVKSVLEEFWQRPGYKPYMFQRMAVLLEGDVERAIGLYARGLAAGEPVLYFSHRFTQDVAPEFYAHPRRQEVLRKFGLDDSSMRKLEIPALPFHEVANDGTARRMLAQPPS